jgi:hypothetical protein
MNEEDLVLRNLAYARFAELGRARTPGGTIASPPGWRPHTRHGNQAILDRVGLTAGFWRLPHSGLPAAVPGIRRHPR